MAYRTKVLQTKAKKFELRKLKDLKTTEKGLLDLEPLLQDVYASRHPKPTDYEVRRDLVRVFNEIAKEIYGKSKEIPVVVEFGSFVMDLFSTTSDLDLSVNFSTAAVAVSREKKIQTLRKFARKLYAIQSKGHVSGVLPITTAKVPILKCVDRGTGVECDISVENRDGILKSQIIHMISCIDERFQKLSFLMKTWAKAQNINSSKDKTLNSLSIVLLVAFHLQTRNPPILPPFSAIFKDGTNPETVVKSLSNFVNYGKRNRETLAELFVTLLIKIKHLPVLVSWQLSSVEKLWPKGLCASTCSGSWTSKTWDSKVASISVEDFTDQSQNVARAVGQAEAKKIYKCIDISIRYILSFMSGYIGVELRELLFGQDGISAPIPRNMHPIAALPCVPSQANQIRRVATGKRRKPAMPFEPMKRQQPMGGCAGKYAEGWEATRLPTEPTQHLDARGCGSTHQPSAGGWGSTHQTGAGGWGGAQQSSAGEWGARATHQASAVNWKSTQQPVARDWEATQQPSAGGWGANQQTSAGDWGATHQASAGSWKSTQQPVARGWGATQQPSAGGWGATQQPSARGWEATQQDSAGDWGATWQDSAGGWGEWTLSTKGTITRHANGS